MTIILRSGGPTPTTTPPPTSTGGGEAPRILRKDPLWSTAWFPYLGGLRWTSEYRKVSGNWVDVNGETGSLDYGPFIAGQRIHLAICGGGATRGGQKIISIRRVSDNSPLVSVTLGAIAPRDAGEPHPAQIETPGISGELVYLRFDDQDATAAGWSWLGVNLSSIVMED